MPELICSADSPDWLTERRRGVTATDITAIVGLSPYESAYSLYFKKRGDIPDEHEDTPRLRLGRVLEDYVVQLWDETDRPFNVGHPDTHGARLYRSQTRSWQLATPDRLVMDNIYTEAANGVLEVKSWADYDRDRWADSPPARVRAQVLWQMDTLDVATGHVGVLFLPSGEFRSYVITHTCDDPENNTCQACMDLELLRAAGRDFMDRLDTNDPPSPDASSATLAALKARFTDIHHDKTAEIDAELWEQFTWHAEEVAAAEGAKRACEAEIREQAGEARTLTVNGQRVATRIVSDSEVKAHTRHSDYIRRATSKGEPE